jgi:hypothetical protein
MCGNRFCCVACAKEWVEKQFKIWEDRILILPKILSWAIYIEVEVPCPRSEEAIHRLVKAWTRAMKDEDYGDGGYLGRIMGMDRKKLLLRCLILNNIDTDEECREHWKSVFPGAKLVTKVIHSWQIPHVFKNQILEVFIPGTPREKVEQWELFQNMHMLRTNVENIFVEEDSPTKMSPEESQEFPEDPLEDTPDAPVDFHLCQICHERLTHRAGVVDAFSPPQTWKWEPIPEKSPPEDP